MKKYKILIGGIVLAGGVALLSSCGSIPKNATPVRNFDLERYLGSWYEIARFDFRFERGLDNTMAQYSPQGKKVKVVNSGYDSEKGEWRSAEGKAKFRSDENTAALKVSFFGPFYSGYNVIALDEEYRYALIAGKNLNYLWILSREKSIPDEIKERYLAIAREVGYDTSKLLWVKHDKISPFENKE